MRPPLECSRRDKAYFAQGQHSFGDVLDGILLKNTARDFELAAYCIAVRYDIIVRAPHSMIAGHHARDRPGVSMIMK